LGCGIPSLAKPRRLPLTDFRLEGRPYLSKNLRTRDPLNCWSVRAVSPNWPEIVLPGRSVHQPFFEVRSGLLLDNE
jgi:hypothetical protein